MAEVSLLKLSCYECHCTLLMISQHRFRWWLGAVRQQAITWANVDPYLCRHMASLGHNELTINFINQQELRGTWNWAPNITQESCDLRSELPEFDVTVPIFMSNQYTKSSINADLWNQHIKIVSHFTTINGFQHNQYPADLIIGICTKCAVTGCDTMELEKVIIVMYFAFPYGIKSVSQNIQSSLWYRKIYIKRLYIHKQYLH